MKKISLYLLIVGLTAPLFSYSNKANQGLKQSLIELNKYWEEVELTGEDRAKPETETELIQLHLNLVVNELRNEDVTHWSKMQQKNRSQLLDELEIYGKKGVFPINTHHEKRTPYFIDDFGTACAVGQLIIKSGNEHLAKSISKNFNYRYIEDMPQEPIKKWAKEHGFTVEELKWIQPGYGPQCPLDSAVPPTCPSGLGCLNPDFYKTSLDSATLIVDVVERNVSNGWKTDSTFWFSFSQGFTPYGLYRFALRDSLNNTDTIYYDLMGPTPFVLKDSAIQVSSQCLNSITLSAQNGAPPYRFRLYTLPWYNVIYPVNGIFDSICPGQYLAWMIDSNFCSYSKQINIGNLPTGFFERIEKENIIIQNPVVNNKLALTTSLSGAKVIRIINLNGKVVTEFETSENNITRNLEVKNGLYILELTHGKEHFQKKIIISN